MLISFSFLTSDKQLLDSARNVLKHLAEQLNAKFSVQLWDGSMVPMGTEIEQGVYISISNPGVIGSLLRRPTMDNLVRQYALGKLDFHGGDMMKFGDIARIDHSHKRIKQISKLLLFRNALPFLVAKDEKVIPEHAFRGDEIGRGDSHRQDQDYVQFHYDVGNDFYKFFLDPEMQYSCAYFTDWNNSIEQAQMDKMEMICRKLRLKPGENMLDIGCGWGGLSCYAAKKFGVNVHGVTLSQTQYDFTIEKVRRLGLENQIKIELRDYNTLDGQYDKISSIGMYEHVGIANYNKYFGKIYSLLRDRGIVLNHGITRRAKKNNKRFSWMRPEHRFIAKYIFPGGELDHIGHTCQVMESSKLEVHDVENWREHYAQTTRLWCQRLTERKDEAIAQVGSERYRLWIAYLAGVSFAFQDGSLRIYQVVASKHSTKGRSELPCTRADLYR